MILSASRPFQHQPQGRGDRSTAEPVLANAVSVLPEGRGCGQLCHKAQMDGWQALGVHVGTRPDPVGRMRVVCMAASF